MAGGGQLIGTELEITKVASARENIEDAGLADLVDIRVGDALETLKNGIGGDVDLVLLDGAFSLYLPVLKLLEPLPEVRRTRNRRELIRGLHRLRA